MKFKLIYGNHWNFGIVVADTLLMLKNALEEMGYQAHIEKKPEPEAGFTYIMLECFDESFVDYIRQIKATGADIWLVATEELNDGTFNLTARQKDDKGHYSNADYWDKRYLHFQQSLEYVSVLLHPNQTQVPFYQEIFNGPVFFMPHGYTEGFRTVLHRDSKDIDFLFTGAMTPYRQRLLDRLINKHYKVEILPVLTASFHRDDVVSRAKVCLNIRQSEQWPHFSNSRANYHINNQSYMISEYCPIHCEVANYIDMPKSDVIDFAEAALLSGEWQKKAVNNLQRYQEQHRLAKLLLPMFSSLGVA